MIARKHLLALAIAALVAGCGGGDTAESPAVPSLSNSALHAPAGALAAVSPQEAARQLMDFAEGVLSGIFPGHPTTGSLGPFSFRAYPGGIFLGVVVAENPVYTFEGVYVVGILGGTLAHPAFVGPLTNFIMPVDPGTGGGGSGTGNGCYDLGLAETPGTHIVETFEYSGSVTGSQTVDSLVGDLTLFEGHQARATATHSTGSNTVQGTTVAVDTNGTFYASRTGTSEMTHYGFSTVAGPATINTVYSPPFVDRQSGLAIGESIIATQTGTTNMTFGGTSLPPSQINTTTTTKYVGQDPVTVPAGTYNTCKFEVTTAGSSGVTTNWVIVGNGIPVQVTLTGDAPVTMKATAISLNGQPLF